MSHTLGERIIRHESGSTLPIFAICLMAIMSLVGATIALGMDTRSASNLQHSADASALGGATAFLNTDSPKADVRLKAAETQARVLATENSHYSLADLDVAAVTEDAYGQHTNLAVELEFQPVNLFAKFVGRNATAPVRRKAVATATAGFPLCVLTLAETGVGLRIKDQGSLLANNCIVWANSKHADAMRFEGGTAEAKAFCAVGDYARDSITKVSPTPETGCQKLPDPLSNYSVPVSGLCDHLQLSIIRIGSTRLRPGIYCGGLDVRARDIALEPGIYHIRGGGINIDARGQVLAEGVTFVFEGLLGQISIRGNSGLRIAAPSEGPTAGVAFAEMEALLPGTRDMIVEGALNVEGVIYMPSYNVRVRKTGGGTTRSPYLQMVANTLEVSEQGALEIDFNMGKTDLPLVIRPAREARLVE
ncbi:MULTISPECIES: TadE/TadG family type IV pilus assembly protein [Henriciella]|jgi:hypothetical protein|uniref:TadE/TadG family type IV pilus assembly protein n=1 Tax=Henriciella TaxID=453849 RepID=UPI003517EC7C